MNWAKRTTQTNEMAVLLNIFLYKLWELGCICEDNIKTLLKIRDVKAEDWMKSPQGRSKMILFCSHCVQPDFPLRYTKLLRCVILQYDHHTWTWTALPIQEGSFAWLYSTVKVVYVLSCCCHPSLAPSNYGFVHGNHQVESMCLLWTFPETPHTSTPFSHQK